jgi:predicted GNAT family acetyltransferase
MRDDYTFRHEQSAEELFGEYQPTAEELAWANQVDSCKLADYTGPLSDEATERAAQLRQAKADRAFDRRMAARVRRGKPPMVKTHRGLKVDGFSI